jgi:hypothetical protein
MGSMFRKNDLEGNASGKKNKQKKPTCLSALKNVPMLGETNNQFYMANMNIEFAVLFLIDFNEKPGWFHWVHVLNHGNFTDIVSALAI